MSISISIYLHHLHLCLLSLYIYKTIDIIYTICIIYIYSCYIFFFFFATGSFSTSTFASPGQWLKTCLHSSFEFRSFNLKTNTLPTEISLQHIENVLYVSPTALLFYTGSFRKHCQCILIS